MMEAASSERAAHIVEAVAGCLRDPEVDLCGYVLLHLLGIGVLFLSSVLRKYLCFVICMLL